MHSPNSVPPPLEWVRSFSQSIERATDTEIQFQIRDTVNPLIKRVVFEFSNTISGPVFLNIWNLFQKYAHANDAVPRGKLELSMRTMVAEVIIKAKKGPPKDVSPIVTEDDFQKRNRDH